ncbi:hypothetical protein BGZ59_007872 [Podila verticillata]|nr:hypothetical protein BGZ59_007872 [Podila verticillata]
MSVQYQQQPCLPYPAPPHGYDATPSDIVASLDIHQQHHQQPQDDGLPALHRISLSDSGPVTSFPQQQPHTRNFSQPPLMIPVNDTFLNPIPAKSEDWAALVDTPASPIQAHPTSRMGPPFQQIPYPQPGPYPRHNSGLPLPLSNANVFGYTDSPAPEQGGEDYLQHGQVQNVDPQAQGTLQSSASLSHRPPLHANTDPSPMGQNFPYSPHQHHKSFSGSGPSDNLYSNNNPSQMAIPPNRQANRKSWSPNSIDSSVDTNSFHNSHNSQGGYLTPPRRFDTNGSSSPRSMSHGKQGSVATSVSLLTDAAIVAKYRETAIKTNDASIQLSYAKYLLDIGEAPAPAGEDNSPPRNTPSPPTSSPTPGSPTDEGNGKKQLALEAIYWIDRLAKEGQPEAQFIRGTWYEDGIYNSKKNADKALKWFQSASKGDYGPAHYKVGFYCEKKKDNNKAVMLYKKAAIHNDVPANHRLAMVYLYGEMGQSKNMKAGLQYLKRAASFATESCPMAPYVLGLILAREYKQLAIPDDIAFPDDGEALEWFKKSASLGYGPANYKLGYCYEYGTLGCVIDPFLSVMHYERAVVAGDGNGEAEMALSGWYLSGAENCFPAQDHLAFQYAAKAAEKKLPKAQYAMGYYYEVGISIPADMQKAMEFYQQAAANGNKEAQTRLTDQVSAFDKLGHKNSIRRIKQGRNAKDNNCIVM